MNNQEIYKGELTSKLIKSGCRAGRRVFRCWKFCEIPHYPEQVLTFRRRILRMEVAQSSGISIRSPVLLVWLWSLSVVIIRSLPDSWSFSIPCEDIVFLPFLLPKLKSWSERVALKSCYPPTDVDCNSPSLTHLNLPFLGSPSLSSVHQSDPTVLRLPLFLSNLSVHNCKTRTYCLLVFCPSSTSVSNALSSSNSEMSPPFNPTANTLVWNVIISLLFHKMFASLPISNSTYHP